MKIAGLALVFLAGVHGAIDRQRVVSQFNPTRNASSLTTPMQVGNGNFAFGADVTGLQTFQPFAILSSWGWKNDTLPPGKTMADVENYEGVSWFNHGRLVEYDFGGEGTMEQWLISNPNRVNLGRIGLSFLSESGDPQSINEQNLTNVHQELQLWSGILISQFQIGGVEVMVKTAASQTTDSIGIEITSALLQTGELGVFLDFPWNDGKAKFSAPFVGNWNATGNHTTTLDTQRGSNAQAQITHTLDSATFFTSVGGDSFNITRDTLTGHRYTLRPSNSSGTFSMTAVFGVGPLHGVSMPAPEAVFDSSMEHWERFWTKSGFIDVATDSTDFRANELQRRIILSRYLMRVNEAGDTPPQEVSQLSESIFSEFTSD